MTMAMTTSIHKSMTKSITLSLKTDMSRSL